MELTAAELKAIKRLTKAIAAYRAAFEDEAALGTIAGWKRVVKLYREMENAIDDWESSRVQST